MTDEELLELAAKAAGCTLGYEIIEDVWNPLTDDAHALRLAVKLQIDVLQNPISKTVCCCGTDEQECEVFEEYGTDPYAATRRAIVRAAACIGKGMK